MATRWGICGTGKIAHDFCICLNHLSKEEHQITAVAEHLSIEKAEDFAKGFGIAESYGSYDEIAADDNIDVVYVALINPFHVEICLKMIEAGKAVLCEKPMAQSLEGCRKVLDAAHRKGVLFVEAFFGRFFPAQTFIKNQLESGIIGDVKLMEASICASLMDLQRTTDIHLGGGGLLDIGVYAVEAANMVFGDAALETVWSDGVLTSDDNEGDGVDKCGVMVLRYSQGRFATLTYSMESPEGHNGMTIRGTKGAIEVPSYFWLPDKVVVNGQVTEFPLPDVKGEFIFKRHEGMIYQAQGVRDCLLKGLTECPLVPRADSESIMAVMQKVLDDFGIKYDAL